MTPFHPNFRRLLRRTIPQLDDDEVNRYESLIAQRFHLVSEKLILRDLKSAPSSKDFDDDITEATKQAGAIFDSYANEYNASLRLWVARRQLAAQQGNFFQIPLSRERLKALIAAIWNYRKVQAQTFPTLAANRVKDYFGKLSIGRVLSIVALVVLLIAGLYALVNQKRLYSLPDSPGLQQPR